MHIDTATQPSINMSMGKKSKTIESTEMLCSDDVLFVKNWYRLQNPNPNLQDFLPATMVGVL